MAVTFNTRAIILRRENWRESDKRVVFYSLDYGKFEAAAVGARKIASKLAGHLEPLREVDLMLAKGKNIDKIGQAVTRENYLKSVSGPESYWYALRAARLLDQLTRPAQSDSVLYNLLSDFLNLLKRNLGAEQWPKVWCAFCLKLVAALGYRPELYHCGRCGKKFQPVTNYFSPAENLFFCATCRPKEPAAIAVPAEILKASRFTLARSFEQILRIKINPAQIKSWQSLIKAMVSAH